MPKYSIIVPCLDSIQFISKTIPLILKNTYSDFEIVISDNRSVDGTFEFLSSISDPRLVVVQPEKRLSMQEHYEFALNFAKGKWINLIGADDFPLPSIFLDMDTLTARNPNCEVINWTRSYFFWPGVEAIYGDIRLSYTELDTQEYVPSNRSFIFGLFGLYQILDLPQLYTCSFISMELITKVKLAGQGNFYAKSIPDIYSSVELLMAARGYVRTHRPLTLVGSSNSSLGIGNRIYLDYENNSSTVCSLLNSLTDRNLHEQKISSYYLLDCYFNYTEKYKIEPKKSFILAGLVGVAGELFMRKRVFQASEDLRSALDLLDISFFLRILIYLLSPTILILRKFYQFKLRVSKWIKLRIDAKSVRILRKPMTGVDDIAEAVSLIVECRVSQHIE